MTEDNGQIRENGYEVKNHYDVLVIGGGPAGLAAASAAYENGAKDVLLVERGSELGGVLNQCIHSGFGLHEFKEELTGPEYAGRFIDRLEGTEVQVLKDTMVIELTHDRHAVLINEHNIYHVSAGAVVLTMGCRERTAGAIGINGYRPAGVMTAGMAQKFANEEGYLVGRNVVIYGSGDIGLIMARRMTLEGASVKMVLEIMPESSGLKRNIAQCLHDFGIPLRLSHCIKEIHGRNRCEGITIAKVDENRNVIEGTEEYVECDTVLLSVGLIPENELTQNAGIVLDNTTSGAVVDNHMMTSADGIFAAGNVLHVHDIVDFVTREATLAGKNAAFYAGGGYVRKGSVNTQPGNGIRYVMPQRIDRDLRGKMTVFMRSQKTYVKPELEIVRGDEVLLTRKYPIMIPSEMVYLEVDLDQVEPSDDLIFRLKEDI